MRLFMIGTIIWALILSVFFILFSKLPSWTVGAVMIGMAVYALFGLACALHDVSVTWSKALEEIRKEEEALKAKSVKEKRDIEIEWRDIAMEFMEW